MTGLTDNEKKFLSCLEAVSDESLWGTAIKVAMQNPTETGIRKLISDLRSQASDNSKMMLGILGQPCFDQLQNL